MKRVVICAGGPKEELLDLHLYCSEESIFIGVDRGTLHLLDVGITPAIAVGDFDSISDEELQQVKRSVQEVIEFDSNKDETDTELAVTRAIDFKPENIILTGVTGGRLDHFQSVLHLLYSLQTENQGINFTIRNVSNELAFLRSGVHRISKLDELPYVSFFAFGGAVSKFTLTGFKYETVNAEIGMGMTKFTSNELVAEVCTISFRQGICLMVRSSDS
ncbi:thiamine diphosphokinase [Sporosarcina sp. Sa2YVA2]|uniref:Thiamine diphosphokinase n=1 Tax=Sporosarcina quadrami TaxID=2762234 RepID=A0ABR8U629_9BACL|nr:thiamine diphosphokinase [Sporosarcina quadrami]MBD7983487.1 thiamine diphosphokinase [Sporosarcina quadrami]